jgi:hypothetical protein
MGSTSRQKPTTTPPQTTHNINVYPQNFIAVQRHKHETKPKKASTQFWDKPARYHLFHKHRSFVASPVILATTE